MGFPHKPAGLSALRFASFVLPLCSPASTGFGSLPTNSASSHDAIPILTAPEIHGASSRAAIAVLVLGALPLTSKKHALADFHSLA